MMSVDMNGNTESNPGPSSRSSSMDRDMKSIRSVTESVERSMGDPSNANTQNSEPIDNDGVKMCQICCNEKSGVALLPCYHMVACIKCARDVSTCAVCGEPVTGTSGMEEDAESNPGPSSQSSSVDSDLEVDWTLNMVMDLCFLLLLS